MYSTQSENFNKNQILVDLRIFGHNVSGALDTMRKGLRAAAAAKICPNDKEAILRIVSEG